MKKLIFILLALTMITCVFTACEKEDELTFGQDDFIINFHGKVLENKDNNILFVEVTDGLELKTAEGKVEIKIDKGEKFYVKYDKDRARIEKDYSTVSDNYKPAVGDEVRVGFFPTQWVEQLDGYKYIDGVDIIKELDNSSSQSDSK